MTVEITTPPLNIREEDGTPSGFPSSLKVSNGTLTANGDGSFSLNTSGAAIGGSVTSGTTGSILFVGPGPVLAQDNANLFWDDTANQLQATALTLTGSSGNILVVDSPTFVVDATNHRVGISNAAPSVPFHESPSALVQYTGIDGSVAKIGHVVECTTTDTSTTANRLLLSTLVANLASNPASSKVIAALAGNVSTPSGLSTNLNKVSFRGLNATSSHNGTNVLRDIIGGQYNGFNNSTGTVTNLTGVKSAVSNADAAGTVTIYKAFEAADVANVGIIGDTYGFYCGIQTAGTQTNLPYAFYNADKDAANYFAGATVPRVTDVGSVSSTPYSLSVDSRYCNIIQLTHTGSSTTITIADDSGVVSPKPYNGQPLTFKIKCTNSQTFSWNSRYIGGDVALPASHTGSSKWRYYSFLYDTGAAKWNYTGTSGGF